jgi:hypothetical protein
MVAPNSLYARFDIGMELGECRHLGIDCVLKKAFIKGSSRSRAAHGNEMNHLSLVNRSIV